MSNLRFLYLWTALSSIRPIDLGSPRGLLRQFCGMHKTLTSKHEYLYNILYQRWFMHKVPAWSLGRTLPISLTSWLLRLNKLLICIVPR